MTRVLHTLVAALLLLGSACATPRDRSLDRTSLLETDRAWAAAAAAGDVPRLASFWADDAVDYFPGAPVARGKDEIRTLVQRNRSKPGFALRWEPTAVKVAASGELGYTSGPFQLSVDDAEGRPVLRHGNYLCIWERAAAGAWKCTVETSVFTE